MKTQSSLRTLALSALLLSACGGPLAFSDTETIWVDDEVAMQKGVKVLQSAEEFEQFIHKPAPSSIDFSKQAVAFFSNGQWPSGGYSARITSVALRDDGHTLEFGTQFTRPGGRCMTTHALTTPYHLVQFDRSTVDFSAEPVTHLEELTRQCE